MTKTSLSHCILNTQKCTIAYNRLTLYLDLPLNLAHQLYKAFIKSKLEFGCTIQGFRIYFIHNAKHLKLSWISSKRCNISDPKNNEIHSHRCARIRTIDTSYWSISQGTSTWSSEAVNKRWLHPIQYDRKEQGT